MKLAKLSLAAITVVSLSASAFAADSFADMFKEGTVSGNLAAYYWNKKEHTTPALSNSGDAVVNSNRSGDIINFGLDLSYKTGSYDGISAGATFQSTHSPFTDSDSMGSKIFNGDMYGSGEVLSEAYVMYANSGAHVKVGRQYFSTPIVAGSGSRTTKQSFEGYSAGYNGLKDTTFTAAYFYAYQDRTDGSGGIAKFSSTGNTDASGTKLDKGINAEKGLYTLYVTNKSIPGVKLGAQYLSVIDVFTVYYMQADYAGKTDSFNYGVSGQYSKSSWDSSATDHKDSGFYGLKASIGMKSLTFTAAYNKTEDDDAATLGVGGGSNQMFSGINLLGSNNKAGEKEYSLQVNYAINNDMSAFAYYVNADMAGDDSQTVATTAVDGKYPVTTVSDYQSYAIGAGYNFSGALKGLGVNAVYEIQSMSAAGVDDANEFRFNAIYAF